MRSNLTPAAAVFGCLLALDGCNREPTGQVVAVVGDDEVTLQEVNAELGNAQVPEGADPKKIQQLALQRIVERRLPASVARDEKLDERPEFLIR